VAFRAKSHSLGQILEVDPGPALTFTPGGGPEPADTTSFDLADIPWLADGLVAVSDLFGMGETSHGSPLVLDLDGDGIELTAMSQTNAFFDIDEDGFAEHIGWIAADDGLLAMDRNADGVINNNNELFGSVDTANGFDELALLDSNVDGVIDVNDTQFGDLLVWRDLNQNGYSSEDELFTLSEIGIESISVSNIQNINEWIEGNHLAKQGGFTFAGGAQGDIFDVFFQYDDQVTISSPDDLANRVEITSAAQALPALRGYGEVASLQLAASEDSTLLSLVQDALQANAGSPSQFFSKVESVIYRWAGVDGVDPSSRGSLVDARQLEALEVFLANTFNGGIDPNGLSAPSIHAAWETFFKSVATKIFVFGFAADAFPDVGYSYAGDLLYGTFDAVAAIDSLSVSQPTELADQWKYWSLVADTMRELAETGGVNVTGGSKLEEIDWALAQAGVPFQFEQLGKGGTFEGSASADDLYPILPTTVGDDMNNAQLGYGGDDTLNDNSNPGTDILVGGDGNDTLTALAGDNVLIGGAGNDTLKSGYGNDRLFGGDGNDTFLNYGKNNVMDGGSGDDRYEVSFQHDVIIDSAGSDTLKVNLSSSSITMDRVDDDLLLTYGKYSVLIQDQFANAPTSYVVETLEYYDSSTLDLTTWSPSSSGDVINGTASNETLSGGALSDYVNGKTGNDTLYGYAGNDKLYGEGGNDRLYGGYHDDLLDGGFGDDTLYGDYGDDTYVFSGGHDIVNEQNRASDNDVVLFGSGITFDDLTFEQINTSHLKISTSANDSMTLQYHLEGSASPAGKYKVEWLEFDDGSRVSLDSVFVEQFGTSGNNWLNGISSGANKANVIHGMEGNDTIRGYDGNDTLYGDDGNDTLEGGKDNDVLYGGNGDDTLKGQYGDNLLIGGAGNDSYYGSSGRDIYRSEAGNDTISESGNNSEDVIQLQDVVDAGGVTLSRVLDDLVIDYGTGNSVTVNGQFAHSAPEFSGVEQLVLGDGSVHDLTRLDLDAMGTASNDTMKGLSVNGDINEAMFGLGGNDTIFGYDGDDVLDGGSGLDTLYGGDGADTFKFSNTDNVDVMGDFSLVEGDAIDVSDVLSGYDSMNDAITDFVQITDDGTSSTLSIDVDGGGDNFVSLATIQYVTGLTDEAALQASGQLIAA